MVGQNVLSVHMDHLRGVDGANGPSHCSIESYLRSIEHSRAHTPLHRDSVEAHRFKAQVSGLGQA